MADLKFAEFFAEKAERPVGFSKTPLDELPLTMTYTPMQKFRELYNEAEALDRGTLFQELDKPFCGKFTGVKR